MRHKVLVKKYNRSLPKMVKACKISLSSREFAVAAILNHNISAHLPHEKQINIVNGTECVIYISPAVKNKN